MMSHILLTTIGSSGDIHPFIAVGQALKSRGQRAILAVPSDAVDKCLAAGLEAHGIFPDYQTLSDIIGDDPDTIVHNVMKSPDYLVRRVLLPSLSDSARKIDALANGASVIVSSMFALGAPMIAQKRNIPIIPLILQPIGILSAASPPLIPDVPVFVRHNPGPIGQAWNRFLIKTMRQELLRRFQKQLNTVRFEHGLKPATHGPLLDFEGYAPLRLATYDPAFAPLPDDAPPNTQITGFPLFDSSSGKPEQLSRELTDFLNNGPPPIVFTLGSFAVYAPGNFYRESLAAARQLGQRAVLLIGPKGTRPDDLGTDFGTDFGTGLDSGVCVVDYAPHSHLFPRASCIVHHGGIGTTGQALLAGKPQLVVPFLGDQPDNADRIAGLGLGRVLSSKVYNRSRAATLLGLLLGDEAMKNRAGAIARNMITDGAIQAARAIEGYLKSR